MKLSAVFINPSLGETLKSKSMTLITILFFSIACFLGWAYARERNKTSSLRSQLKQANDSALFWQNSLAKVYRENNANNPDGV